MLVEAKPSAEWMNAPDSLVRRGDESTVSTLPRRGRNSRQTRENIIEKNNRNTLKKTGYIK